MAPDPLTNPIVQPGEPASNALRARLAAVEPAALRTYTPSQLVIARSEGCYHYTPEGRKLADFTAGVLVANLGHNPRRWWQRVLGYMRLADLAGDREYLPALPLTSYNALSELETLAGERLLANLRREPGGGRLEQVLWAASGSEAIQKALWACLARRPGESIILATRRGFHGKKGLAGAVTGCETDPERDARVRFLSFPTAECDSWRRRREPLDLAPYQAELARLWDEHGRKICALVTEPYLGGGGSYHPQPEYLQLLERFCREHDVVFVLDEIQSNFGRTGAMYAFTTYGLAPDVVVLGKGLGNGVPVDAAVGPAALFAHLRYGEASDTWSAHPLGSAAVLATLDEFESHDVLGHARRLSEVIRQGLLRLEALPIVARVRGEGTVWGVECQALGSHSAEEVASACVLAAYRGDEQGRAIHLLGPLSGKVLRISPPLTMPLDDAGEHFAALEAIFSALAARLASA